MAGLAETMLGWSGRPDPTMIDEITGQPVRRDVFGNIVQYGPLNPPATAAAEPQLEATRARGSRGTSPPVNRLGDLASAVAAGATQGITAPRRALDGEPVTLGDVWATALDWGVMSPLGAAPKGALRAGAGHNRPAAVTAADIMTPGYRYSPSRLAAHNLKTGRGSYEQIRAELLRNGAKPDELVWTGFDDAFKGKTKITRQDVVDHFDRYSDTVSTNVRSSSGVLGDDDSYDDLVERYVEQNLESETDYYRTDWLPERLNDEYKQVRDLTEDELVAVMDAEGFDAGDIDDFLKDYEDQWVVDGYVYPEDAAIDLAFGDPEDMARDSLYEAARHGMTEVDLREYVGAGDAFDPGDTEYSNYFTKGGSDYQELTTVFDDPYGLNTNRGARADAHFSDAPLFHARTARFDDGKTYHVGEIQSDWAQHGRGNMRTPEEEVAFANSVNDPLVAVGNLENAAIDAAYEAPYEASRQMLPNAVVARSMLVDGPTQTARNNMVRGGMDTPRYATERVLDNSVPSPLRDFRAGGFFPSLDVVSATPNAQPAPDALPAARYLWDNRPMPEGEGFLPGFGDGPVQAVSRAFWERQPETLPALLSRAAEYGNIRNMDAAGPYVTTTDKWVTAAIRNALADAVASNADRVTFGTSELARDMTMMPDASGAKFYDEIVPRLAAKEAKRYGGNLDYGRLHTTDHYARVPQIKLTPEFVEQVKRKGIPLFAGAPLAAGLADLFASPTETQQPPV